MSEPHELPTFTRVEPTEHMKPPKRGGLRPTFPEQQKHMIGETIRKARKARRMTQRELGEISGVNHKQICEYENGNCFPAIPLLFALFLALDLDLNVLARQFKNEADSRKKRLVE